MVKKAKVDDIDIIAELAIQMWGADSLQELIADISKNMAKEDAQYFIKYVGDGDNYCALPGSSNDMLYFDEEQHKALMKEIEEMRESGELLARVLNIACPVIAFHGTYDPHPTRGVSEPLEGKIADFRMITMEQCGHDPWKETYAREEFFEKFFEIV